MSGPLQRFSAVVIFNSVACEDHRRVIHLISNATGRAWHEIADTALADVREHVTNFDQLPAKGQSRRYMAALGRLWRSCSDRDPGHAATEIVDRLRRQVQTHEGAERAVISVKFLRHLIDEYDPVADVLARWGLTDEVA